MEPSSWLHQLGYRTMSKPKFQTEWEEIDQEYQQLQVNNPPGAERLFVRVREPGAGSSSPRTHASLVG